MCVGGPGACVCRLRSSHLTTVVLLCRSQKAKQARLEPPPAFSSQQILPIKEKKMCWREQFLPLRSSLMTYTGKEFVYIIIFSLTASPKAAMIQAPPASPTVKSAWDGLREGCSCHWASPSPAPNPAALTSPCANPLCPNHHRPQLGLCVLPTAGASLGPWGALPGSRDHHQQDAPEGMCPASAARVILVQSPALGAAPLAQSVCNFKAVLAMPKAKV